MFVNFRKKTTPSNLSEFWNSLDHYCLYKYIDSLVWWLAGKICIIEKLQLPIMPLIGCTVTPVPKVPSFVKLDSSSEQHLQSTYSSTDLLI